MSDITSEQKAELLLRYKQNGDKSLRNEIVLAYMNIVKYAAISTRSMYLKYTDSEDIINEATIALIYAIDSFNLDKNVKFETYASIKVRGAIIDYIRSQDIVPRSIRKFAREYDAAYSELYVSLDREPMPFEIAEHMKLSSDKFDNLIYQAAAAQTLSFEELMLGTGFDIPDSVSDDGVWSSEAIVYHQEKLEYLAKAIIMLSEKERLVITLYYYEKLKFSDIGKVLGLTESRICQIHTQSVSKMKKFMSEYLNT